MSSEELNKFLSHIWGSGGTVFLAYKDNPTAFDVPPAKQWPQDRENIIAFFLAATARGKDTYFSPAIYKAGSTSKHKTNVEKSRVLWVDFDGNAADAVKLVEEENLLPPTYRIISGREGHEHWYWLLDKYYPVDQFEPMNKRLAYYTGADKACWNADRVLRPPFTRNHKDPKNPRAVDILSCDRNKYSLEDFDALPEVSNVTTAEKVLEFGELPTVADVLADYKWNPQHKDLFLNTPNVQGSRDQSLMRLAYYMAEVGMPDAAMFVMLDDMSARIGKFVGRADRNRRLSDMIVKARAKHPYGATKVVETEEDIQQVFTINELLRADFKLDWLVPDLLAHRTFNIVEALPGTGKSRLTLQWAESLASGQHFIDWEIEEPIKVMYLSLEMDRYMLKHFAEGLANGKEYADNVASNFLLVPVGSPIPVETKEGMDFLKFLLEKHRPQVVFIDALGSLTEDELKETVSKQIVNRMNELIAEFDVCMILVHHLRKDQQGKKGPPTRSDTFGSQYIAANAALILGLWAPDEQDPSHIELLQLKTRATKQTEKIVLDGTHGFSFIKKDLMEDDDNDKSFAGFKIGL